jgi:hypothetical protein
VSNDQRRTCGVCDRKNIPVGVDWPWWRDEKPVHLPCSYIPIEIPGPDPFNGEGDDCDPAQDGE